MAVSFQSLLLTRGFYQHLIGGESDDRSDIVRDLKASIPPPHVVQNVLMVDSCPLGLGFSLKA